VTRAYLYSANPPPDPHAEPAGPANALDAYAVGIPNTVTTVLASFRGYDTMGETAVILTAGLGVLAILRGARHRRYDPEAPVDIEPHDDGLAP